MKKTSSYRLLMLVTILVVLLNTWIAVHAIGTLFAAQTWLFHTLDTISQTEGLAVEVRTGKGRRGGLYREAGSSQCRQGHDLGCG